jgi:hypothetical protein
VPQPIEINGIFVSAGDRCDARHHHLEHRMLDAVRIAAIRHCFGEPQANTMFALRLPQQQQTRIGRLGAAIKIDCEFLAADGWQVEGKQRIVGHGGCGRGLIREATCRNNDLPRESAASRHSRRKQFYFVINPG